MSNFSSGSRVSIPNNVLPIIQHIREITGKQHTDEDIYTELKECSMDPNETTQKLLFLDPFHVVQRKPRRKEVSNSRVPEDSRLPANTQGRGARGNRGNYSSQYNSSGSSVGRNSSWRVNGVGNRIERGPISSSSATLQKLANDAAAAPHLKKRTAAIPNGPTNLTNGTSSPSRAPPSAGDVIDVQDSSTEANKDTEPPTCSDVVEQLPSNNIPTFVSVVKVDTAKSTTSSDQLPSGSPSYAPGVYSSASDPVLVPTINSGHQSAVGSQRIVAELINGQVENHLSDSGVADLDISKSENVALSAVNRKVLNNLNAEAKGQVPEAHQSSSLPIHAGPAVRSSIYDGQSPQEPIAPSKVVESEVAAVDAGSSSQSVPDSKVSGRQLVIFPNHFQVPEALRNGLTFGSFDPSFGPTIKSNGPAGDDKSLLSVESSRECDDTAQKHPSNQSETSMVQEVDYTDHAQPTPNVLDKGSSEGNVAAGVHPRYDQLRQDILLHSEGPQNPAIQNATNYSIGLMLPVLGSQLVQYEAPEPQARDVSRLPNFMGGSSPAISSPTPSPSPPVAQTAGVASQNTIPVSPQPFPLFRQPYPPNFFPYGPYFSPFFMPPMHQFLGPNGFPQQASASNVYLPPAAAASGVKYSVPQFKAGPNPGNPAHIGLPPGYGSYSSTHVGYGPSPAVSSGSSTGGEDLVASSQLKENHIYTSTGQLSEGSAVWFSAPGQDISHLPVSSLYNLPPQGQHLTYSPVQPGHAAYAGIYQSPQTMAAPSAALPLTQHSQAPAGVVESAGPPQSQSGSYQHAQMNWNGNL